MRNTLYGAAVALMALTLGAGCAGNSLPVDAAPDEIVVHAENELSRGKYLNAAESLEFFLRTYPGNAQAPRVKLRLGDARFGLREYVVASGYYDDVVRDYPASEWVEEARFKIALCAYESIYPYDRDQSETERAIVLLEEFIRDFPDSEFSAEAAEALAVGEERLARREFEAGRFYERQKRLRSAYIQYLYVLEKFSNTDWARPACFRIAEIYRTRGRLEKAETFYQRVVREWPTSDEASEAKLHLESLDFARVTEPGGGS